MAPAALSLLTVLDTVKTKPSAAPKGAGLDSVCAR